MSRNVFKNSGCVNILCCLPYCPDHKNVFFACRPFCTNFHQANRLYMNIAIYTGTHQTDKKTDRRSKDLISSCQVLDNRHGHPQREGSKCFLKNMGNFEWILSYFKLVIVETWDYLTAAVVTYNLDIYPISLICILRPFVINCWLANMNNLFRLEPVVEFTQERL